MRQSRVLRRFVVAAGADAQGGGAAVQPGRMQLGQMQAVAQTQVLHAGAGHSANPGDQARGGGVAEGQLGDGLPGLLGLRAGGEDHAVMGRLAAHRVGIAGVAGEQEGLTATAAEVLVLLVAVAAGLGHPVIATEAIEAEGFAPNVIQTVFAHIGKLHRQLPRAMARQRRTIRGDVEEQIAPAVHAGLGPLLVVHGVDSHEQVACRKQIKRSGLLDFFRQLEPCRVVMEACGGSHYWAREFRALGHDVRLIAPQFVKPYVKGGKNDANDAEAICEAGSRPTMRYVPIKSEEQQAALSVHRIRSRAIRARTALVNEIRGLLGEFGLIEARKGVAATRALLARTLEESSGLPAAMRELMGELQDELQEKDKRIALLDRLIQQQARQDERVQRLMQIEGLGPISATAMVAAVGDARQFKSGRQLAAWLGLVPNQHSSGGKERLGSISKRGDTYLRTLLIHGARSALNASAKKTDPRSIWINEVKCRRNTNIATVALANKNARIIWALLSKGERYKNAAC
ncbi:hypothetical protein L1887_47388 [Cichorium endivia]|nr:hypothetical protein L1887_47388 [Cichorium endivia]